jgi:heme/copper-type cytochrome/quinol oxidase subunit 1
VFAIFAGFYYWIGKMSGHQYPEFWGRAHFWITFVGVNLTFFPMHFLGVSGMPRRYPDYPEAFVGWNFVSSIGSYISGLGMLVFLFVVYRTLTSKVPLASIIGAKARLRSNGRLARRPIPHLQVTHVELTSQCKHALRMSGRAHWLWSRLVSWLVGGYHSNHVYERERAFGPSLRDQEFRFL